MPTLGDQVERRMHPGDEKELPVRRDGGFQRPRGMWGPVLCGLLEVSWLDRHGTPLLQSLLSDAPREDFATWPREGSGGRQHQGTANGHFEVQSRTVVCVRAHTEEC